MLAAHSGGAAVALDGAAAHPGLIAGLFLLDPPTDSRVMPPATKEGMLAGLAGPHSLEIQKQFYATIAGPNPKVRDRVLADCETVNRDARLGVARALADWNPEPRLNAWRGPIHIVASKANAKGPALYDLRPDISHSVVPNAGHGIQLDDPALVIRALRAFGERLERAETASAATMS